MSVKFYFSSLILLVSMCLCVGCSEKGPVPNTDLNLESDLVEVSAEGGLVTVAYLLTNPVEGALLKVENKVEWISDLDVTDSKITFHVSQNQEESARETKLILVYPRLTETASFMVRQHGSSSVSVEENIVEVPCYGGNRRIAFSVKNPVSGKKLYAKCEDNWIENLSVSEKEIVFDVACNTEMASRETVIILEYDGADRQQIVIRQEAALQPVIILDSQKYEIPAEGGHGEIGYSIQNPVEGEVVSVNSEAQWIEQLKADGRTITFEVGENTTINSRTASIQVNYKNADAVFLDVSQSAGQGGEVLVEANGVEFKMVYVRGGTFIMGATSEQFNAASDEYPEHQVTLNDYFMGQYEVTQELWQAVMGTNPSAHTGDPNLPVEQVSWDDCQLFIVELNKITGLKFSIPTEAQWEYAARGGERAKGLLFSGSDFADEVAWFNDMESHIVGQLQPNELGIFDMSGNVYEWCRDFYGDYTDEPQTDPEGVTDGWGRVLRGGCFYEWIDEKLRVSSRHMDAPDYADDGYGLRIALAK